MNDSQHLLIYYKNFFPGSKLFKWLEIDEYREVSFCLNDNIYARNLIFQDYDEFNDKLLKTVPLKIDIGAVYDVRPLKSVSKKFKKKELVFDIDLTDYERKCCENKSLCNLCFPLIKVAVELLNYSLRNELGFEKLCFVYSGRRGVHCWVKDEDTKYYSEHERGDIVAFFDTVKEKKIYPEEYTNILRKYCSYLQEQEVTLDALYDRMFLRLDRDVTRSTKHLLKIPFCVHPDSKNISIPIDVDNLDNFEISSIPKIEDVIKDPNIIQTYIEILDKWLDC